LRRILPTLLVFDFSQKIKRGNPLSVLEKKKGKHQQPLGIQQQQQNELFSTSQIFKSKKEDKKERK
tara:strand:- start:31 stop:228 length:198 start_codon:yes stop_codon:yes gene_type:complete